MVTDRAAAERAYVPSPPADTPVRHLHTTRGRPAGGGGSGEGLIHAAIKAFIKDDPLAALGEPMTYQDEDLTENLGPEIRFITGDRVDLLMKDESGRYVVIEVERHIGPGDHIGSTRPASTGC